MTTPRRVRKRDGREVPFDIRKITDAIDRALIASGGSDQRGLAEELASAVVLSLTRHPFGGVSGARLRQRHLDQELTRDEPVEIERAAPQMDGVPGVELIDELVERVLRETGRDLAAAAHIRRRAEMDKARLAIAVHRDSSASRENGNGVRAASATRSEAWSKGKIVNALIMEAELPRSLAEEIANQVETRVFSSGFSRVSTSLLRELVDNELFIRGLETHLRRQAIVGLPKYDLRQGLRTGVFRDVAASGDLVAWTNTPEICVARTVLSRYAIEDLLPPRLADRHLSGEIHLEGIESPHRYRSTALSLTEVSRRSLPMLSALPLPRDLEEALDQLRTVLSAVRRTTSGEVVLVHAENWLQPWLRGGKRSRSFDLSERFVRALLTRGDEIPLGLLLEPSSAIAPHLLNAAFSLATQGYPVSMVPRMYIGGGTCDASAALTILELARELGGGWPDHQLPIPRIAVGGSDALNLGPGLRAISGEFETGIHSVGAVAVLNLPGLSYEVPAWSEGRLLERVLACVDDAVESLAHLQTGLREMATSRGADFPAHRPTMAMGFVGLRECVRFNQEGTVDPRLAQSVVQAIVERSQAAALARGIKIVIEPWIESRARARFERLDGELKPHAAMFGDGDRIRYTDGATLSPVPGVKRGVVEATVLSGLSGCVLPALSTLEETWDWGMCFSKVALESKGTNRHTTSWNRSAGSHENGGAA
ncbi:MAG: hypothetical protein HY286_04070 [Planctomycetes bacterium]|nr:hypothetical protein [Planctomycetota bacterium]